MKSPFGKDYRRDDEEGKLELINDQLIAAQKGVFSYLVKKIGAALLTGRSIMNVSLPVKIFGKASILQRFYILKPNYMLH